MNAAAVANRFSRDFSIACSTACSSGTGRSTEAFTSRTRGGACARCMEMILTLSSDSNGRRPASIS